MKTKARRLIFLALTLGWMAVIFAFSAQVAAESDATSDGFITVLCSLFLSGFKSLSQAEKLEIIDNLTFVVRKCAHAGVYALLAVWVMGFFQTLDLPRKRRFLLTLLVCVLYAASDELHQFFVPGRSCQLRDVGIDSAGAAAGAALWLLGEHILERKRKHG